MYREHFGLRQALLGKDSMELWDDGAHALLRERFQWLLHSPGLGLLTGYEKEPVMESDGNCYSKNAVFLY
jgi:hypothetical protein